MPRRMWICCLAVLLPLFAASARADFVVSIGSPTIPQGGTGTLDVFLTSTASSASPDLLNNYAFTLQITGPNELQFSSSQSFAYLTSSQYVFAGDSTNSDDVEPRRDRCHDGLYQRHVHRQRFDFLRQSGFPVVGQYAGLAGGPHARRHDHQSR